MKMEVEKLNSQAQEASRKHIVCSAQWVGEKKSPREAEAWVMGQKKV